jgi:DNA-binding beta-propeller fold protein YncE
MKTIRPLRNSSLRLQARLFLAAPVILLLLATQDIAFAQNATGNFSAGSDDLDTADLGLQRRSIIYETNYQGNSVDIYSLTGQHLGVFALSFKPTGLAFDNAGNLYVASNDPAGNSIEKFEPDGTGSIFADSGLSNPSGLAFDTAGNLYVANPHNNTIERFTPDGVGTEFANEEDGLLQPTGLAFDTAGNLYVSNAIGGPFGIGSIEKFTPDGVGSVFADTGLRTPFGLAFDTAGNLYVSNNRSNTIEKFSPTGEDLGVFASTGLHSPLGMMFDRSGNLYVANVRTNTIEKFSPTGQDLGVFAHTPGAPHFLAMFTPSP